MPVVFAIDGTDYEYPATWADVTLKQFLAYLQNVEAHKPSRAKRIAKLLEEVAEIEHYGEDGTKEKAELKELEDGLTEHEYMLEYLPYKAKYISHWCGFDAVNLLHPQEIEVLFDQIDSNFKTPEFEEIELSEIEFKGEKYYLPSTGMRGATLGEFMAACQIEELFEQLKGNNLFALPSLMGVLLRKTGEQFDNELAKKRAKEFEGMDMLNAWKVSFFLQNLNKRLPKILDFFTQAEVLHKLTSQQLATH